MLGTPTRHGLELNKTHVVDDSAKEVEVDTMSLCPQLVLLAKVNLFKSFGELSLLFSLTQKMHIWAG